MSEPSSPPPRRFGGPMGVLIFVGTAVMISLVWTQIQQAGKKSGETLQQFGAVPGFVFFDEAGNAVSPATLAGKFSVWSFAAAGDAVNTPMMNRRMLDLQTALEEMRDEQVGLFTVVTTPSSQSEIAAMAAEAGARAGRWRFLSGPAEAVDAFASEGLFGSEDGRSLSPEQKARRLVLVDTGGQVRGFRDGENPEAAANILLDLGSLVRESQKPPAERE